MEKCVLAHKGLFSLLILLLTALTAPGAGKVSPEEKLRELDEALLQKEYYDSVKETRISQHRGALRRAVSDQERWGVTAVLFDEYASYKYDSAYAYALRMGEMAASMHSADRIVEAECAKVYCLISAGLFKEAFDVADAISTEGISERTLLEYYKIQVRLNYSARGYAQTEPYWEIYSAAGENYSRKILDMVPPGSVLWQEYQANYLMEQTRFEESMAVFTELLADPDLNLHSRAIFSSSLGWMLLRRERYDEAVVALCESALCDLKSSTKETTALRMLADLLSQRGEVERPSSYVRHSFDDANFYNARLRKLEVGAVLPIVEKNHYEDLQRERNLLLVSILLAILIAVVTLLSYAYIRRQNRRLKEARQGIEERNRQLEEANAQLSEANAIKTEYIGNSFYINAEFIDKMAQLYKMVDRMIVTRQYEELRRSLKESTIDKERDQMYASFDATFLKIFPTFVNDYNALFPDTEQNYPAEGLTSEMRIFALIRLGIMETERIAKFLDYSVHTINTYKTRVKNKSWVENERFEAEIMKIGTK